MTTRISASGSLVNSPLTSTVTLCSLPVNVNGRLYSLETGAPASDLCANSAA
jgi:hypothetical protein